MKKITLLFLTMLSWCSYSQLALEDFEDAFPPTDWLVINNAGPIVMWGLNQFENPNQPPYQGDYAAFLDRENVTDGTTTDDWLVTPQFTVPANPQLRFFSRLTLIPNNSNTYEIKISTNPDQNLQSAYVTIQTWTEPQLNPSPLTYTEKLVTIPAQYIGQQVYIAFVMYSDNGDRWLIDNVSVDQQCLDPTTLSALNISQTSADLSWANPSGATSWEIEVVPQASAPDGSGEIYTGPLPYEATGLTEGTDYKFYVRALCSTSNPSQWAGPFNFSTGSLGETCETAIAISALPYSVTDNTSGYGDDYSGSPGSSGCGSTSAYLNGDDVVYAYTAPSDGAISIDLTGIGTYTGVFVYGSCANIGVSCIAGSVSGFGSAPLSIPLVSVTAGATYYIVISTWAAPQSTPYTLTVQQVNCPPPTGLTAGGATSSSASLSWDTNGATSWEVFVQAQGAGIPSAAGTTTSVNTNYNVTQTTAGVAFAPATTYEYYVRADCGSGDGTFSAWSGPYTFSTLCVAFDLPFSEGFNSTSTTEMCWTVLNVNGDTDAWNMNYTTTPYEGNQSAMMYTDGNSGSNNDWLISPTINLTGNQRLRYRYRVQSSGEPNDFEVLVSTSGLGTANFTTTLVPLASYNNTAYAEAIVNITDAGNIPLSGLVNIAWHVPPGGLDGWRLYIDNVIIEDIPSCPDPINLAVLGSTTTTAELSWTAGFNETAWQVVVQPQGTGAPTASSVIIDAGTNPFTATGLFASTQYEYYVRANCAIDDQSNWVGPFAFTTACDAFDVPFFEGFNTTSTSEFCWTVVNANGDGDAWDMNYNLNTFEGNQVAALYTDYNNGANNDWLISPTINLTGNQRLRYRYRVQSSGEPNNFEVLVSTAGIATANFTIELVPLATYSNTAYVEVIVNLLNGSTPITGPVNIAWHVPSGGPDGWRVYIDNVIVEDIPSCPDPTDLAVLGTTTTTAQLEWTPGYLETAWQVVVQPVGTGLPTGTSTILDATANPYTATGLSPYTQYEYYVRANCGVDDLSNWVGPLTFTTSIGNDDCEGAVTLPVNPTAACALVVPATFTGATASPQANPCTGVNGGDIWFEFTATSAAHNVSLSGFGGTAQPVVLSLYEGDECGALTNIMCSYTNVINATGLVSGTTYKVRAVLNATSAALDTSFDVCVNTPPPPANSNQTECIITTINYDFELPEPPGPTIYPHFVSHYVVQGWRTTAADQQMEFWSAPNYENVPAYSGDQFIELNANLVSGVYQDYQTPQPTVFSYGFAHRGRQGTDTCQLLAGPPGGPYLPVTTATTGNSAWIYYTGTYTVPAGQTVTRFIFQSISSVGGASVGNYLDAITFTANNGLLSENPMLLDCSNNIANVSAAGVGTWSAYSDNPGATVIASAGSNNTTISGFTASGTYRYDWTTQYCTSTLQVTYNSADIPAPLATPEVNYCTGDVSAALTAEVLAGNTLNWYTVPTGGTPLAGAPLPGTATAGTTVYYVSQSSPEGCESLRTEITVIVSDVPAAPVAQDVEYCAGDTATQLTADVAAGNTLNWYATETGGTALADAPTPDTAAANITNYYVSQVAPGGCESARTEVMVTVNAVIVAVTGFTYPTTVCSEAGSILPDTAEGFTPGGTFTANGLTIDPVTGEIDVATAGIGSFEITYEVLGNANCFQGGSSSFTITINNSIVPVTAFDFEDSYCYNTANATPSPAAGFTAGGTFTATGGLIIDATTGTVDLSSAEPGSYTVTYSIAPDVANCNPGGSFSDTFTVGDSLGFSLEGDCESSGYIIRTPIDFDPAGASYEWVNEDGLTVGTDNTFNVTEYINGTPSEDVFPIDFILTVAINGCESSTSYTVDGVQCNIQKGISPGDGNFNEFFDLSGFNVKNLSIFNRYGQEVYSYGNYTNQWKGQDKNGNELPTGTYFYSFERGNGQAQTGWVYINRQN